MEVNKVQTSYSLYTADDQRRYLTDQGPFQNEIVAGGIEGAALRSIFTDATNPSYIVKLMGKSYDLIEQRMEADRSVGYGAVHFTGIVSEGDVYDLGCPVEVQSLLASASEYVGLDPALRFQIITPGNHDGGQYMGNIWSPRNLFGIANIGGADYREDTCGPDHSITVEDRITITDHLVRHPDQCAEKSYQELMTVVSRGNGSFYYLVGRDEKKLFSNHVETFTTFWHETPALDRFDAVVHFNGHEKDPEESDVRDWIHMQAVKQEEFSLASGETVPIYHLGLDSQDFTAAPAWQASIRGHVSAMQVSLAENFMDEMLKRNPNAKFKIAMHYPVESLNDASRRQVKRLLNRDEVILISHGHVHKERFDRDLRTLFSLRGRTTPLARLGVPSLIDEPRTMVMERIIFSDGGVAGKYTIKFEFEFVGLEAKDLATEKERPAVFAMQEDFIQRLMASRCTYFDHGVWEDKAGQCADGVGFDDVYSHGDELLKQTPLDLQLVAESKHNRFKQFLRIIRTLFNFGDQFMNRLTVHSSIPQMRADFESYQVFLGCLWELLVQEGLSELADRLQTLMVHMQLVKMQWDQEWANVSEHVGYKQRRAFNDLYTRANLHETVGFINHALPQDSDAKLFAILIGMEASEEDHDDHHPEDALEDLIQKVPLRIPQEPGNTESFSYRYPVY
ncbi:hypothetical protein KKF63_08990 [bacterium]|nr:hypothetical protein [bacterium]